jgi:hypothetical protein
MNKRPQRRTRDDPASSLAAQDLDSIISAEVWRRTRTSFRTTDFKSGFPVLTSFYYALPSSTYKRFSRQSKFRLAWYEHVTPYLPLILKGTVMKRLKSPGRAQRFLSAFGIISSHFRVGRHLYRARGYRDVMKSRFVLWTVAIGNRTAAS